MGHGKETPRQKMIGMMYLFLTAMLAIKVSKEVLDSFVLVNDSLTVTVENFTEKNKKVYAEFANQKVINEAKVKKWSDMADVVHVRSDELYDYVNQLKTELVTVAEGPESIAIVDDMVVAADISVKDNTTIGNNVMIGPTGNGKGQELKEKLEAHRKYLFDLIPDTDGNAIVRNSIAKNINTSPPKAKTAEEANQTWQQSQFQDIPLVAVITMLTKLQSDIRNAEADVLRYLYGQIDIGEFKFNKLDGIVIPESSGIITGGEFSAKVFMAAFDTTQFPTIYVGSYDEQADGSYKMKGNYDSLPIRNGMGVFTTVARRAGEAEWGGLIVMKAPDGTYKQYPFKNKYMVNDPMAVISASANTVFYSGIPNPLEVSVPGLSMDKIYPSATNARIVKKGKGWEITPTASKGEVVITVMADVDGKKQRIRSQNFRIMPVPPPTAKLDGKISGRIRATDMLSAGGVDAVLENFIMDNITYVIKSYTFVTQDGLYASPIPNTGRNFNERVIDKIRSLKRNERLTIENIIATGPGGDKNIGSLVFTIN
ncbi:MAG: gliding motility protein GldM [Salinivirgaceae bacterium]|nr:gliding motility protein GldM [Salinivirgaceae bacterium]